jgi:hypothetical protein
MKRDSTAVVVVARTEDDRLQLVGHRIWTPTKGQPLDFSATLEPYLVELVDRFKVEAILYDPRMIEQSGLEWQKKRWPVEEFPQTSENLTRAGKGCST